MVEKKDGKELVLKKNFQLDLAKYLSEKDFVYGPEPELYGPIAGFYSYGLNGKAMKNNLENVIRKVFTKNGFFEVEYPLICPEIIWEASGHLKGFNDPIISCSKCKGSFRADKLIEESIGVAADHFKDAELVSAIKENEILCPSCKGRFVLEIKRQSLMLKTIIGSDTVAYNRPETATTTYLPFKHYVNFFRGKLPFTVFQIGKAFRNEISPRQHLLRQREFTQAESQMFLSKEMKTNFEWFSDVQNDELPLWTEEMQKSKKKWEMISLTKALDKKFLKNKAYAWNLWLSFQIITALGIPVEKIRFRQHHSDEKAFYSDDTWDLEVELNSFGWVEMVGVSDRTNYDLSQHSKYSKQELTVRTENGGVFTPDVIEIAFGVDRPFYAILDLAFFRREVDAQRTVLSLPNHIAPIQIGVFPLLKKDGLPEKAKEVLEVLDDFKCYYDESGSIGKRYSRLDAIGVPFCITIDHDSLKDNSVTIRERDSLKQIRVKINELKNTINEMMKK
ncbi:MAG: glycine--tRNA ligase [Candidatus Diapherotrites archaeon]|uniref:glycine--tRNA ligase n=1 Tax=Candidatus Iainarchaeum sp. TaxID=3101447 RepID=A0A7K4BYU7_9ARCH|nr:glycine--tRNA ligase [Candidatus Diapherotrites archaeon]